MRIQRALDSDIAMVFDECTPYPATETQAADSMRLSPALGRALQARVHAGIAQRAVRHRAGRHVRGAARRVARGARARSASTATRSAGCRSASPRTTCADPGPHRAAPARGPAALPDGRGHARGPVDGGRCRHRHVRLRAADAQRAQRLALHPPRRRQDPQRALPRRHRGRSTRPARCYTCRNFTPRLPAPPAARQRDPRRAAEHPAQPALLPGADARAARGDRRPAGSPRSRRARRSRGRARDRCYNFAPRFSRDFRSDEFPC